MLERLGRTGLFDADDDAERSDLGSGATEDSTIYAQYAPASESHRLVFHADACVLLGLVSQRKLNVESFERAHKKYGDALVYLERAKRIAPAKHTWAIECLTHYRIAILFIERFSGNSGQGSRQGASIWPYAKAAHDELRLAASLYDEFHEAWPGGKLETWCHGYKPGCFAGATAHLVLDGAIEHLAQVQLTIQAATQLHLTKKDLHVIQSVICPNQGSTEIEKPFLINLLEQQGLQLKGASASKLQDALDLLSNRDPGRRRDAGPVKPADADPSQSRDLRSSARGLRRSSRVVPDYYQVN
jgi:hypothetical protein